MRSNHRALTRGAIQMATRMAEHQAADMLRRAELYAEDLERAAREPALVCKACWYFRRGALAGQAFTAWTCGVCATEATHHDTATPKVCRECAAKHFLCTRCGGDLYMRTNRRTFPELTLPATEGEG